MTESLFLCILLRQSSVVSTRGHIHSHVCESVVVPHTHSQLHNYIKTQQAVFSPHVIFLCILGYKGRHVCLLANQKIRA